MNERDRYRGKPLLRLLELQVLWSIGQLAPADLQRLESIEPMLRATYKREGTWHDVLAAEMECPEKYVEKFRDSWVEFQRQSGNRADPETFARQLVDLILKTDP
jgi:hypothetical protein